MVCYFCQVHHVYNVSTMLRAHCIANQLREFWLHDRTFAMEEVQYIIEQIKLVGSRREEKLDELCKTFKPVNVCNLFEFSTKIYEDEEKNWGRLITIFAFSAKIMNEDNADIITEWLTCVLLLHNPIWK